MFICTKYESSVFFIVEGCDCQDSSGMRVSDTLLLVGKILIHITVVFNISTIIQIGIWAKGIELQVAWYWFYKKRFCCCMSDTCWIATVVLRLTSRRYYLRHSNYIPIRSIVMPKPSCLYMLIMFLLFVTRYMIYCGEIYLYTKITTKGILLMSIILAPINMSLFISRIFLSKFT